MKVSSNSLGKKKLTIIVPIYNADKFLDDTIASIIKQDSSEKVELMLIDDGSTDNTKSVCEKAISKYSGADIKYFRKKNGGKSSALNFGIPKSTGSYILILDADDYLKDGILSKIFWFLSQFDVTDLLIGGFEVMYKNEIIGNREPPANSDPIQLKKQMILGLTTPFSLNSVVFRKSLFNKVNGFSEELLRAQDTDFSCKLLDQSPEVSLIDHSVFVYRKHRTSKFKRVRLRIKTIKYKCIMADKNLNLPYKWFFIYIYIPSIELLKLFYEVFKPYGS